MSGEARLSLFYLIVVLAFYTALVCVGVPPIQPDAIAGNAIVYAATWFLIASAGCLRELARSRPEAPIRHLRHTVFGATFRRRGLETWPLFLLAVVFMAAFSEMKSAIPLFHEYSWDQSFIDLDRSLHGQDPWRLLQPILGYPVITSLISIAYQLWLLLIYAGTLYFALYVDDRKLRVRYFSAFFGIWTINGVVLAIIFASVGPCFVGPLLGNAHYADQMAYLHRANAFFPVMTLDVQQQLLAWKTDGSHGLGRGITAMPSMHVSLAFLSYLAMRQHSRTLGRIFLAFLIIIMVGSVHLGYHYAIDGYVSIVTTAIIWMLCGSRSGAPLGKMKSLFRAPIARPL